MTGAGEFVTEWNPEGLCNFEDAHGVCDEKATRWVVTEDDERQARCDEHG